MIYLNSVTVAKIYTNFCVAEVVNRKPKCTFSRVRLCFLKWSVYFWKR